MGGKRPLTEAGFWDASRDERFVRGWWRRWPHANVGVPTGRKSGLLVLDVDPRDGGDRSLEALERGGGPAPRTTRARTGGGGLHLYFRNPSSRVVRNSAGLLGRGLDVRGEGGYVVVPPSRTIGDYAWSDRAPAAEPSWLLGLLEEMEALLAGSYTLF